MFFDTVIQHHFKIRTSDFLQIVIHPAIGFVNFGDVIQINRPDDDHRITFGVINGGLKII
jgi:hypothetical protein